MLWELKKVLVTVKAYPNPSKKYGETVCVAGIDLTTEKWIRLYPIQYRDLEDEKKFRKYSIIEIRAHKAPDDTRSESFKVDADSIKVLEWYDTRTKDGWNKRKKIVLPTLAPSYCDLLKGSEKSGLSLGMFKPHRIAFTHKKVKLQNKTERDVCYAQLSFYNKSKQAIEEIPFDFRYQFFCQGRHDCLGHDLPIIDWEIGQAYRTWRFTYKDEAVLLEKIKERWLDNLCSMKNDTYFFVGNMKRFRQNFMILGVFYPPTK
ncbi:MAG: hypothetical protein M0Z67_01180 [Nitrospiraceae bacterium]|nr:hypothetical protein [Nitrospiraceae bacterium]